VVVITTCSCCIWAAVVALAGSQACCYACSNLPEEWLVHLVQAGACRKGWEVVLLVGFVLGLGGSWPLRGGSSAVLAAGVYAMPAGELLAAYVNSLLKEQLGARAEQMNVLCACLFWLECMRLLQALL
jgi:hypothetical protein